MTTIANALGIGSGIDTAALITSLTAAARDPKDAALKVRETANTAKISAIGTAAGAIDSFATSLGALISGGTLFTQPTTSDAATLAASALPGARLDGFAATVEIERLAQGQSNASAPLPSASEKVGTGTITLNVNGKSLVVTITQANDSLNGLAAAINAKKVGVTASIVTDTQGARLVLKGATGAENAFTMTVPTNGPDPVDYSVGLARFAYTADGSGGLARKQEALDAKLTIDGIATTNASNTISTLVPGVQLTLVRPTGTTPVTLGSQRSTAALKSAVEDFVSAYNTLETMLDDYTAAGSDGTGGGALAGEASMRAMRRALSGISTTVLASGSGPKTLADIGVRTQRDGSLKLDATTIDRALANDPAGVEALFNPGQSSDSGLVAIASAYGKAKPGSYVLENLVPAADGAAAGGTIAGKPAIGSGDTLTAATTSPAGGLVVRVAGAVSKATVTVDLGLGGALQAIRDALRGDKGVLTSASNRLATETRSIAEARSKMEARITAYKAQLETSFGAMEARMSLIRATQTQLTNQIAQWNKSDS